MNAFRTDLIGIGSLSVLARELNRLGRWANSLRGGSGVRVANSEHGAVLHAFVQGRFTTQSAYDIVDLDGASIKIAAGMLPMHGIGYYDTAETTLTLGGSTEWVCVRHNVDHSATAIIHSASASCPQSDGSYWYVPLWKLVSTDGGQNYGTVVDYRCVANMGAPT